MKARSYMVKTSLLALIAGVALTIAVATACALIAQLRAGALTSVAPEEITSLTARLQLEPGEGVYNGATGKLSGIGYREFRITAPGVFFAAGRNIGLGPWEVSEIEAGWPLRCLRRSTLTRVDFDSVFGNKPRVVSLDSHAIVVPVHPLWTTLTINSLCYGLLLWLVLFSPRILRRIHRTRQCLCPECGYPRGASDRCSECGKILPKTS